jgi:hypothetical protein
MAKQTINIGTTANDGTGDPIRAAFEKVNDNFTEIYTANTGTNTGDQDLSAYATTAAVAAGYQPLDSDLTAISALTTTAYGRALLSTADAATLRSAIGVGRADAPTFLAQTLTGQSLTSSQSTNLLDLATTWDTVGTPTGIKLDVINTNSNPAALLMDLQVSGGTKFKVAKGGSFSFRAGNTFADISSDGVGRILMNPTAPNGVRISGDLHIGTADVVLIQDASGILAQRNGTAKQALRVYNTNLSTAPEWAEFDWITSGVGNTLRIGTNLSGTGGARPIEFVVGGVVRWTIATSGNATFTGGLTIGSSAAFAFSGRVLFSAPSVGVYLLQNNTQDDFNRLQLGGTTSAFPAIKRNGTGIDIVLANDSGFAPVKGKLTTDTAYTATVVAATGYITIYDSTGTAYRVPCAV